MKALIGALLVFLSVNCFAATRSIVPRATSEGGIGTAAKIWNLGYFNDISAAYGVTAVTGTFTGALIGTTLDTGQGANELYDMDQNVLVASEVTFAKITDSGVLDVTGNVYTGATNYRSTFTAASGNMDAGGAITAAGAITAGAGLQGTTGVLTDTSASSLDIGGGLNAGTGNVALVDATGKITALSGTEVANLSGAALTGLTAANISAGRLAATVMASSVTLEGFYSDSIVRANLGLTIGTDVLAPNGSGASLTALTAANISAGNLDAVTSLTASSGTITGALSVGTDLIVAATGTARLPTRTIAQLMAATAIAGEVGICSDCTPVEIFISTGAGAPNTGGYGTGAGLQLD